MRNAVVSISKSWSIRRPSSDGRRGWTYSGDISSEASIVSRSGPFIEVMVYGAVALKLLSTSADVVAGSFGRAE